MTKLAQELIEREKEERTGYLDLGRCGLRELPDLSDLYWLDTLIVSNEWYDAEQRKWFESRNKMSPNYLNKVTDNYLPTGLTKIVLNGEWGKNWGISDGDFLKNLTNLSELYLSSNRIRDWSFLENLTNLSLLNLSDNKIRDGDFLEKLTNLSLLDISYNNIRDGDFLENLTNLSALYLGSNYINVWFFLEKLTKLSLLDLSRNKIKDAGFLNKVTSLEILDLSFNKIKDIGFLEKMTSLKTLDLTFNKIKDIGLLEKLTSLRKIDLAYNQLNNLAPIKYFFQEKGMKVICRSPYETKYWEINVQGNPLQTPPEDVVQQGNVAILEYFRQLEKTGAAPLLEAKLILLGDGRAGKTSLANRLLGKAMPKETDRTLGVDIVIGEYGFPVAEGRQFKLHIWDFAGQDKYKPLHQFFYTEGAVYVLVADSGNRGTDYDDWLQTAQLFGGGSPLLAVLNEFKDGIGYGTFDPEHWQKRFPGLLKQHFLVNLLSEKNVDILKNAIHLYAQSLPHTLVEYPKNWAAIRRELEHRRDENFISFGEYLKICRQNELPEKESALILSSVLHKIGVCLHYQQSDLLRQYVILKNEWATDAVYKILEDRIVAEEKKGFFDWEDLRRIWSDDTYSEMRPQLLELMQQFKMAYPLPNVSEFVAPPLLSPRPPKGWELPPEASLELYVEYEFLPKALLTQFIVTRHTDIDQGRTLVWRNGVVLRWPDALAEVVKAKSQGRDAFGIRAQGRNRKGLLTAILKTLRDLHSSYKGIKVAEIVPCPCSGCRNGKNKQHFFDFDNLKNRLEKGRRVVECDKSLEEVELLQLLGDLLVFDNLRVGEPVVMKDTQAPVKTGGENKAPLAFFSHSNSEQDLKHLEELHKQLIPLVRSGKIRLWDKRKISAGAERDKEINQALGTADIVFLLLSSDFLAKDDIWDTEMAEVMRRHEAGTARVIPIKLRVCSCEDTPFSKLQGLPRNYTAISAAPDRDSVWTEVLEEIKQVLSDWKGAQVK
ncbi:COR domain-containing protein [Haliscomenobacter hydrossis]|uniref:Small GTP-binding protein n=1 Tax=Haliscomenobacter hydrossis (strain ATCC 27775 / DSM 1100 / LMG 10767 / O) TaxID=760192 RepID=F4KSN1_HALH1|nr:COR domain-containing protein [Haliscomenobacter hydrossis]AEE47995.1 small GTP-binding protein [Haliscomenobacter hydrossis DSM 1100]